MVVAMFTILYYASPNVKMRGLRWVAPGAAFALAVWLVASAAFALYVANFGSYNATYGAFAGAVILLVWLWLTNVALLFGAEIDAVRAEVSQEADRPSSAPAATSIGSPVPDSRHTARGSAAS